MDDTPTIVYRLDAENSIEASFGTKYVRPTLFIRCQERQTSAYVNTEVPANPELGLYNQATVRVRFDDGAATSSAWGEATSNDAFFAPSPVAFIRKMAKAKTLRWEFTPFRGSPTLITFQVEGFGERMNEIAKACRWKQP